MKEKRPTKKQWHPWEGVFSEEAIELVKARGLSKDQADASEAIRGEEVCSICEDTRVQTGTAELQKEHTALGTPALSLCVSH